MRSVLAVLAGLAAFSLALFAMEAGGTALMFRIDPSLPPDASIINRNAVTMALWVVWLAVSMAAGGCVTARIAPGRRAGHAAAMGTIQALMTLAAMFSVQSDDPLWFWIAGIAAMIPAAWYGGARYARRIASGVVSASTA